MRIVAPAFTRRKYRKKRDPAAWNETAALLQQISAATKDLHDIPHCWPLMQARGLPAIQYTAREVRSGGVAGRCGHLELWRSCPGTKMEWGTPSRWPVPLSFPNPFRSLHSHTITCANASDLCLNLSCSRITQRDSSLRDGCCGQKISMHGGTMKRTLISWVVGVALLTVALLPMVFRAQPASPRPSASAATLQAAEANPAPQHHPRIVAAIRHLEQARGELEAAPSIFHGHREAAIKRVNEAIEECNKALESVR